MKKFAIVAVILIASFAFATMSFACPDKKDGKPCDGQIKDHPCMMKEEAAKATPSVFDAKQAVGTKATCPVMGNELTIAEDTLFTEIDGTFVYYCCPGCKEKFEADPSKYLKK
jgi:YHS domain-containing protein